MGAQPHKTVFLDRDGTIIEDLEYLSDPDKIGFLPGAVDALHMLQAAGFLLVVITNQSGVARGFFDEAICRAVYERFKEALAAEGVPIAASYYCPHLPGAPVPEYDQVCDCRKPAKGLFEKAASELNIDFTRSWAVGDMLRDLEPAKNLGARTILVLTGKGREQSAEPQAAAIADITATDLVEAAQVITQASSQ